MGGFLPSHVGRNISTQKFPVSALAFCCWSWRAHRLVAAIDADDADADADGAAGAVREAVISLSQHCHCHPVRAARTHRDVCTPWPSPTIACCHRWLGWSESLRVDRASVSWSPCWPSLVGVPGAGPCQRADATLRPDRTGWTGCTAPWAG